MLVDFVSFSPTINGYEGQTWADEGLDGTCKLENSPHVNFNETTTKNKPPSFATLAASPGFWAAGTLPQTLNFMPPLAQMTLPVVHPASGKQSMPTTPATSSLYPGRPPAFCEAS